MSGPMDRIADVLRRHAGLRLDGPRLEAIRSMIGSGRDESLEAYADRLEVDDELVADLIDEVTVGETYFRRGPGHFELLRDEVLPCLLRELEEAGSSRHIRFWSAGCATGEEPYTVAIVMHRMGIADRVRIVGTDVNRCALEAARRGRYRKWSFRAMTDDLRDAYFRERGNEYELSPEIRKLVEFRHLNLVTDEIPSSKGGAGDRDEVTRDAFDVILCRNVLIYMTPEHQQAVGRKLVSCLRPGGWLLPGPSDPRLNESPDCSDDVTHTGLVYRRVSTDPEGRGLKGAFRRTLRPPSTAAKPPDEHPGGADGLIRAWPSLKKSDARWNPLPMPEVENPIATEKPSATERLEAEGAEVEEWWELARQMADRGDLESADRVLIRALERFPEASSLHLLRALVLGERDRVEEAIQDARAAIYLDDRNLAAHLIMATLLLRRGQEERAELAYAHAIRLARTAREASGGSVADDEERLLDVLASRSSKLWRREPA
ncbi:MAG: CheR family methyltransferase [Longimicrobiales bacterium]|nr:CheR family methyltransferase [Longimicrobiales bacterium]